MVQGMTAGAGLTQLSNMSCVNWVLPMIFGAPAGVNEVQGPTASSQACGQALPRTDVTNETPD
jgi:hypothetical protein